MIIISYNYLFVWIASFLAMTQSVDVIDSLCFVESEICERSAAI